MTAPPKPWERTGVNNQYTNDTFGNQMSGVLNPGTGVPLSAGASAPARTNPPPLPTRPSQQRSAVSPYGSSYGSGYGGYMGGYGNYGSGMYSSPFGSSMYGGGGGLYGTGMGMNRFGAGDQYTTNSFVRVAEDSSRQAFQSIESIVQAFGSVAMMLESTFCAVYNSFRAVIGVADHFTRLRTHFTQVFSAFALIRTLKWIYHRLLVLLRLQQAGVHDEVWSEALAESGLSPLEGGNSKPSTNWPILFFFAVIVGGPWLIWKFLSSMAKTQGQGWANGESDHFVGQAEYNFTAENDDELSFRRGQRINIAPKELQPRMRGWLLACVDGKKIGIVPANYIKVLGKRRGRKLSHSAMPSTTQENPHNTITKLRELSPSTVSTQQRTSPSYEEDMTEVFNSAPDGSTAAVGSQLVASDTANVDETLEAPFESGRTGASTGADRSSIADVEASVILDNTDNKDINPS